MSKELPQSNRVDSIRKSVILDEDKQMRYRLLMLVLSDKLVLINNLLTDKEKVELLEETNAVFTELVEGMFDNE